MDRFVGGMAGAVLNAPNIPFFGYGIGMGTNVGAILISGDRRFLISEEEWGRIIGELGLLLGFIIIFIRVSFCLHVLKKGIKELRNGNTLPWMLLSCAFINVWQGGWAQPTSLGFATLEGGLILAAFNYWQLEDASLFEEQDEENGEETEHLTPEIEEVQ